MRAIVTVIGKDQVGIIASVCALLAEHNVNVLIMLVDAAHTDLPFAELVTALESAGRERDLVIHAQREDIFNAMHRI